LSTGDIPQEQKSAFVTPIFKKGKRHDPSNHCPVSLTSIICKTIEHILVSHNYHETFGNQLLCNNQFGFRARHSCESQPLLTIDDFARALNNRLQVDIRILDFSKAFDKVPHTQLMPG